MDSIQQAQTVPDTVPVIVIEEGAGDALRAAAESGVEFHGAVLTKLKTAVFGTREAPADRLRESWQRVATHLAEILDSPAAPRPAGFQLEEIEVGLAVDAKGTLGIASAGVGASLKLKWRRAKVT